MNSQSILLLITVIAAALWSIIDAKISITHKTVFFADQSVNTTEEAWKHTLDVISKFPQHVSVESPSEVSLVNYFEHVQNSPMMQVSGEQNFTAIMPSAYTINKTLTTKFNKPFFTPRSLYAVYWYMEGSMNFFEPRNDNTPKFVIVFINGPDSYNQTEAEKKAYILKHEKNITCIKLYIVYISKTKEQNDIDYFARITGTAQRVIYISGIENFSSAVFDEIYANAADCNPTTDPPPSVPNPNPNPKPNPNPNPGNSASSTITIDANTNAQATKNFVRFFRADILMLFQLAAVARIRRG